MPSVSDPVPRFEHTTDIQELGYGAAYVATVVS